MERDFISAREYKQLDQKAKPKPALARNLILAFLSGGSISVLGQAVSNFFISLGFSSQEAGNPTTAVFIFMGALLTGLGVFDKIANFAGAGVVVPVTGFANSITSAALEFKREGFVLGVGSKMFVLAGSVITFGVVTAFIVGIIASIL